MFGGMFTALLFRIQVPQNNTPQTGYLHASSNLHLGVLAAVVKNKLLIEGNAKQSQQMRDEPLM